MAQCGLRASTARDRLVGDVKLAIHIEDVFPWLAVHGAGLDLGQVGAQGGKLVQCGHQRARAVLNRECKADLVCSGSGIASPARRTRKKRV